MIFAAAIATTYYFLQGAGPLLERIRAFILTKLEMIITIAKVCSPKLEELNRFLDCVGSIN
jgi:hypothetical protein